MNLFCANLTQDWESFKKFFKVVHAGGGLVTNPKNEVLFIFRSNVWDLPKGRHEEGESIEETAVREVEEECGGRRFKIDSAINNHASSVLYGQHSADENYTLVFDDCRFSEKFKTSIRRGNYTSCF